MGSTWVVVVVADMLRWDAIALMDLVEMPHC